MKSVAIGVVIGLLAIAALWAQKPQIAAQREHSVNQSPHPQGSSTPGAAVAKGAQWLASVQGHDGGWGQDGGETSYVRNGERLESNGNDVANTAVAALALRRAGPQYKANVERAVDFILQRVEASPAEGLTITSVNGTQIQRKLGPYIDTFLTSMLLTEMDGTRSNPAANARVRRALEKCVAKIQQNQLGDGSWNISGGWAPVLGTSLASRSLYEARQKGVRVDDKVILRSEEYTVKAMLPVTQAGTEERKAFSRLAVPAESAGVALYQSAQALEQLSRTEKDRVKNAPQIAAIKSQLNDARFVDGFGSIGGEEFFSYLNVSDGLRRTGGEEWRKWHDQTTTKIVNLQNSDGTWAGHHCITGRVAVTSAAILNLTVDNAPLR